MSLIRKHLLTDQFLQIIHNGGSVFGTIVSVEGDWVELKDPDDGQIGLSSISPNVVKPMYFGDEARANYKKLKDAQGPSSSLDEMIRLVRSPGQTRQ